MPERTHFGESDLVVLRQGPRVALAKVQSSGRKKDYWELTLRCHFGNDRSDASAGLFTRSAWEILKLNSWISFLSRMVYTVAYWKYAVVARLSTIHREYSALKSLPFLELSDHILRPRPPTLAEPDVKMIEEAMRSYQVNKPQAMAIIGSLKTRGFSLIQGHVLSFFFLPLLLIEFSFVLSQTTGYW